MFGVESESQLIKCPICDDGDIRVVFYPASKKDNLTTTVAGRRSKVFNVTKERYEAENECPVCGASKRTIEKAINTGEEYNKPSREKILERMKKAGLPMRI